MKTVTTATALEILGEDYRFPTALEYDGSIENGLLKGNLYIKGSGDPSLGSAHFAPDHKRFLQEWISALKKVGIHKIQGAVIADSSFIVGAPFATDRYLYGIVPANREWYPLKGDIPDPALFLADYLTRQLEHEGITVGESPSCFRILREAGRWQPGKRTEIVTTYSPTLREIVEVTNHVSHNLFADALIKTIGLRYTPRKGEVISSFNRGIQVLRDYWQGKGLDLSCVRR